MTLYVHGFSPSCGPAASSTSGSVSFCPRKGRKLCFFRRAATTCCLQQCFTSRMEAKHCFLTFSARALANASCCGVEGFHRRPPFMLRMVCQVFQKHKLPTPQLPSSTALWAKRRRATGEQAPCTFSAQNTGELRFCQKHGMASLCNSR